MAADNHTTIVGNLVDDPELRFTNTGIAVTNLRVAVHDSRQNDRNPVIWQAGQDYRAANAIQAARAQPTRTRWGPERVGPER